MIRHFKMELKRRDEPSAFSGLDQVRQHQQPPAPAPAAPKPAGPKRQRNRRSSKPQMEKRRRARINQCLDTLKRYVLTEAGNLAHLGIDASSSENHNEESLARTILNASGLIYRHKGRKNPSKLEKADILELTVGYVQRLHQQRDRLLLESQSLAAAGSSPAPGLTSRAGPAGVHVATAPMSPPASSASSSPAPTPLLLLGPKFGGPQVSGGAQPVITASTLVAAETQALDLSDNRRIHQRSQAAHFRPEARTAGWSRGQLLAEDRDGCWRPVNEAAMALASLGQSSGLVV